MIDKSEAVESSNAAIIRRAYDRRSPYYDRIIKLLSIGMEGEYRREAVRRLNLKRGDRVLDLGCGTGLNFPLIIKEIGAEGSIIGIDLSHGMLLRAQENLSRFQADRVSLICGDVTAFQFPGEYFDALISTYLFSTIPEYKRSLDMGLNSLKKGGHVVLADDILPAGWFAGPSIMLSWLLKYGWRNYSREIMTFIRSRAGEFTVTWHHLNLIYIISGRKLEMPEKGSKPSS
jgi:ubiquinone/menaquinone biosynthesis C-methylase UbiE